jgi:NTP pyrophosphatase (non-canonical NTP hydrolase)
MSGDYRTIYDANSNTQGHGVYGRTMRLIKLTEETGEVAQALIGTLGANARKGRTHEDRDVAKELADVAITAIVALHDWLPLNADPVLFLNEQAARVAERCRTEGS